MNQRRGKINVKDGGEEHKMHKQSQSKKQQHIHNGLPGREVEAVLGTYNDLDVENMKDENYQHILFFQV